MRNKRSKLEPKIYKSKKDTPKGNILYFHGGGFFLGGKYDLPKYHIEQITTAGYNIISLNYPLAPESKFPIIIDYIIDSINSFIKKIDQPYFLWGRSAGAYLSLLAYGKGLDKKPNGIISYYGYGLLVSDWYSQPNQEYLKQPLIKKESITNLIEDDMILSSPVNPRYLLYLYSRQTGKWIDMVSDTSVEDFVDKYNLENFSLENYPPVLLAHNTKDYDVPYKESVELSKKISNSRLLTFNTDTHDFDRNTNDHNTIKLIDATINFIDQNI